MTNDGRSCSTCRYAGKRRNYDDWPCQAHAPITRIVEPSRDIREYVPVWPIMRGDDWCGDWQPEIHDETGASKP